MALGLATASASTDFNIMGEKTDDMDRISNLPDFILHHIMSFLDPKEMAKTSVLSKRWKYLRESFPILDFDQSYFVGKRQQIHDEGFYRSVLDFVDFVHRTMLKFCKLMFQMQKFRIFVNFASLRGSSLLDGWIGLALQYGVQELNVDIQTGRDRPYNFPHKIFSAKSLTTLRLVGCKLEQPSDTLSFCFLKSLTLDEVHLSEQMIQKLTSECPLLEELFLYCCWGIKCYCISKPLKLKVLGIHVSREDEDGLQRIEIAVPSLQEFSLEFENQRMGSCVIDMAGCPHLNDLALIGDIFKDQEFHEFISKFPLLEELYMESCCGLEKVTISSNRLKELWIGQCANLKAIDVDTPNLRSFTYEHNPVPLSSINAPCRWRVVFVYGDVDALWYTNIKQFLRPSNKSCKLTINVESSEDPFDLYDFRKSSPALFCEVEHLTLCTQRLPSNYAALLDWIFSICYPKYLTVETKGEDQKIFIKRIFEELGDVRVSCCNSHDIKCWRHYFKEFFVESSLITEEVDYLDMDNLLEEWSSRPEEICFFLDWSIPADDSIAVET